MIQRFSLSLPPPSPLSLSLFLSQNVKQGPKSHHSTVWKSQRDKHLPNVTKFDPPEDFLDQLNAQIYGPSTQLIKSNASSY